MGDKVFNVLGSIVILAIVTTLVLPGRETANVLGAGGKAFTSAINAGLGKG